MLIFQIQINLYKNEPSIIETVLIFKSVNHFLDTESKYSY